MTKKLLVPSAFLVVLLMAVYGCNSQQPKTPTSTPSGAADVHGENDQLGHDDADHGQADETTDMQKMTKALASFSPEDRESAMKQHFCPVGGEMLGSMGAPEKVDVNGQTVWICCDGCRDKLLADPDKYLAKLKEDH